MKHSILILVVALVLTSFFSCERSTINPVQELIETPEEMHLSEISSIEDVKTLRLDQRFSLPEDIYQEFLQHISFYDGQLGSFNHKVINEYLSDFRASQEFWSVFGLKINRDFEFETFGRNDCILNKYKKKKRAGSCRSNDDFACYICPPSKGGASK